MTTKSTFGSIYLTLALIALIVAGGFCALAELVVAPKLIEERAQAVLSVIRSHEEDIILNKTRTLRDELLKSGIIADDQQFSHYFFDEKKKVSPHLSECRFLSPSLCIGRVASVFFEVNSDRPPRDDFKFAVVLSANLSRPPIFLRLWGDWL
jgi:hypothetical protein